MREHAEQNAQRFIKRLAERVDRLEAVLPDNTNEVFHEALAHPSTSLLIQKAILTASVSDIDERHEILSELIRQRLTANADDMVALAGSHACDIVGMLASHHIKLVAIATIAYHIRPSDIINVSDQDEYNQLHVEYWRHMLREIVSSYDREPAQYDVRYLAGLGCLVKSVFTAEFDDVMKLKNAKDFLYQNSSDLFSKEDWLGKFVTIFEAELHNFVPTPTGILIGTLYRDSISDGQTAIGWP